MYQPRTLGFTKRDPLKRWSVPDRVFFACGSCHILAHAFLERYGRPEHVVTWIKPSEARSREIDGLWLAEPGQFLYDPLPRARSYLDRFPSPDRIALS